MRSGIKQLVLWMLLFGALGTSTARADGGFSGFSGRWKGSGNMTMSEGKTENLRCIATYFPTAHGAQLKMNMRCASTGFKIDVKSSLQSSGKRISGNFEEHNYNIVGSISGNVSGGNISATIHGPDWQSSLSVSGFGAHVVLTPRGSSVKSISLSFKRS